MSYISLYIERDTLRHSVVSQKGYRKELLYKYKNDVDRVNPYMKTPAAQDLVSKKDESEDYGDTKHY